MERVLFFFAHQDDEYFAAPWIRHEVSLGNDVACLYFTNGGSRTEPSIRDAESRRALLALGVNPQRITFLEGTTRIPDGGLVRHLDLAKTFVNAWLAQHEFTPKRIYAPDFEGGHADHDAAHLVALAVAIERDIVSDSWGFALYNAFRCPRPVFRVLRLLSRPGTKCLTYSLRDGWAFAVMCRLYESQRRTWIGLFPESLFRRLFVRRECVNRFETARISHRPHQGDLLYEWLFGVPYADFVREARAFSETLLS